MADIGAVIGGYKIRSLLQTGQESQVFEVVEPLSNRHFAMKILLPEFASSASHRRKLFSEAEIGSKLRHENVINIVKVNKSPETPHFIMEFFPSGSIRKRLMSRDPRDKEFLKEQARRIFKEAATGLAYMNSSGYIHLDVKPDNILVNALGQTKIIDFAISKPIVKGFFAKLFRRRGLPEGTATYMSPEQIRVDLLDTRSDIYSFGIAMYEVVTGRPPFRGNSIADLYRKHFFEKPATPVVHNPDVTEEFANMLLKMLAKKPEDRYQNFHEILIEGRKVKLFTSINDTTEESEY